jgi:tRNA G46 methylase TrmB
MLQERGILKEANLEKKITAPLKETTAKDGKAAIRKNKNVNIKFHCELNLPLLIYHCISKICFFFSLPFRKMKHVQRKVIKTIIAAAARNHTEQHNKTKL